MPSVQTWDPALYARNARFVSDLGSGVLTLLAPQPGERILDLGCGDGVLTKKLVDLGCQVVAVDSSVPQIEAARKLGLDAHVMDGEALPFERNRWRSSRAVVFPHSGRLCNAAGASGVPRR
jgi:trans-aconitate methyltransferase